MTSFLSPEARARVDALVEGMTLEQKLGQMTQPERMTVSAEEVRSRHIGSVLSGAGSFPGDNRPADWVAMNEAYWEASTQGGDGHTGIPLLYGVDAVHGHNNVRGATIFPHSIGLGAAGDPDLTRRIARATAREVAATGVRWNFAPCIAVPQDLRWGRTYEGFGNGPDLVAAHGAAYVEGLQQEERIRAEFNYDQFKETFEEVMSNYRNQ